MKAKKLFFKECHLAGRQYHDVDEVWDELHVGTQLELQRDLLLMWTLGSSKNTCLVIFPVVRTRLSLNSWKWVGKTSLSAASAKLILKLTTRTRYV